MKYKLKYWLLRVFIVLTLIPSCLSANISETSRQGFEPVFSTSCQGSSVLLSATTAGFLAAETKLTAGMIVFTKYHGRYLAHLKDGLGSTIALTNRDGHAIARIGYDAFGNFRWPNNKGHLKPPCNEKDLGEWLDRFDVGRSFGFQHDAHHWGRHFSSAISPYLFTGRRWDGFTGQYFNRNRYMNPKYGRFTSRDPIGFGGDLNLYRYAANNPLGYTDPWGKQPEFPFWKQNTFEKFTEEYNLDPNDLTTQLIYEEMVLSRQDPDVMMGRMVEILANLESVAAIEKLGMKFLSRGPANVKCVTQQAVEKAKKIKMSELEFDLQMFGGKGPKIDMNKPIQQQLAGEGQLAALRRNPNLKGVNIDDLISRTPKDLDDMVKAGRLDKKTKKQIMKAFEGRDLRKGQ